jgi:hypothetical protein
VGLGTLALVVSFGKSNETDLLAVEMTGVLSLGERELDFLPIEGGLGNEIGKLQVVSTNWPQTRLEYTKTNNLHRLLTSGGLSLGLCLLVYVIRGGGCR